MCPPEFANLQMPLCCPLEILNKPDNSTAQL